MQILMSEAAHGRVGGALAMVDPTADVVTIDAAGDLKRGGKVVPAESVDPEIFWVSLDMYTNKELPGYFRQMLRSSRGKWAQTFNAGLDSPVFASIMGKGIRLSKSSAQAPAIAEYVVCHALSLLAPIARYRKAQAAHEWKSVPFREVAETRWVIVGFGSIGSEIARRVKPFDAHVTVVRRSPAPDPLVDDVRATSDLLSLLPDADVVVLACSLNDETRGIAGPAFFAAMKPGSILINIGRGGLLDEAALQAGLDVDKPAAAVLDVFETEPLPADAWAWDHPKVRVSSHCAGAGSGVLRRGDELFLENYRRFLAGEPLLHEASLSEVGL